MLDVIIECNTKIVQTYNLTNTYKPYKKPNDETNIST